MEQQPSQTGTLKARLTTDQKKLIKTYAKEGLSGVEISHKTGISTSSVLYWKRKFAPKKVKTTTRRKKIVVNVAASSESTAEAKKTLPEALYYKSQYKLYADLFAKALAQLATHGIEFKV
jgi:predicted DNA-binding protein YlxM (UPF0122 family)